MKRKDADELLNVMRSASARTFALSWTLADRIALAVIAVSFGCAAGMAAPASAWVTRLVIGAWATAGAYAVVVILRGLVPLVLCISFVDMMRLRLPFYLWFFAVVIVLGLSAPVVSLFASGVGAAAEVVLALLAVAMLVRFYQTGALARLALAFAFAGGAVGASVLGLLVLALVFVLMHLLARAVLTPLGYGWCDTLSEGVVDYYRNPIVGLRMKWIFLFCFFGGLGSAVCLMLLVSVPTDPRAFLSRWLSGCDVSGLVFLLAGVVFPVFLLLRRVREATDADACLTASLAAVYFLIGSASAGMLLFSEQLLAPLGGFRPDGRILAMAQLACAYGVILSAMVMLVDIRCRVLSGKDHRQTDGLKSSMRFSYALATAAPLVLLIAVCVLRAPMPMPALTGPEPASQELALTAEEALRVAIGRKDVELAERYARRILSECPNDVLANRVLGERCLASGNHAAAVVYAERIYALAEDDRDALMFLRETYEARGDTEKTAAVLKRLARLRPADAEAPAR